MLVKFLSFVASVLGTARYKAVALSCLALVFSVSGAVGVVLWHNGQDTNVANQVKQPSKQSNEQQDSPQLGDQQKQTIQSEAPQQNSNSSRQPTDTDQPTKNSKTPATDTEPSETNVITLTQDKLSLTAGATSEAITATLQSELTNTLTLEIVIDTATGLNLEQQEVTTGSIRFVIRASSDSKKDQSHTITVVAKDANQKIISSQAIAVTIQ